MLSPLLLSLALATPPALDGLTLVAAEGKPLKDVAVVVVTETELRFAPSVREKVKVLLSRQDAEAAGGLTLPALAGALDEALKARGALGYAVLAVEPSVPFGWAKRALATVEAKKLIPVFAVQAKKGLRIVLDGSGSKVCMVEVGDGSRFDEGLKKALALDVNDNMVMVVPARSPRPGCLSAEQHAAPVVEPAAPELSKNEKLEIQWVIVMAMPKVQDCYTQLLLKEPNLKGGIEASFIVLPDGKVTELKLTSKDLDGSPLMACMKTAFEKMQFDKTPSGKSIKVQYPFVFQPMAPQERPE